MFFFWDYSEVQEIKMKKKYIQEVGTESVGSSDTKPGDLVNRHSYVEWPSIPEFTYQNGQLS